MTLFLLALGLFFVIEGLLYALFPGAIKRMAEYAAEMSPLALRIAGTCSLALGVLIVWLVR